MGTEPPENCLLIQVSQNTQGDHKCMVADRQGVLYVTDMRNVRINMTQWQSKTLPSR